MEYGKLDRCQSCDGSDLHPVLFIGYLPPVNTMRPIAAMPDAIEGYPAEVSYCGTCHLVQLRYAVDPNVLFPAEYPYTSGSTAILRENFVDLYRQVTREIGLSEEDLIVDVGSNDGTLLANFAEHGHRALGIEPTGVAELARARGIPTMRTFFDRDSVDRAVGEHGRAKLVTATNVFAHIHGVHSVIDNVAALLRPDGVFITESHYLLDLIETVQYDTIYHEHLRYYSVLSIKNLLDRHGFRVIKVKRIPTHGGSIRVVATRSADVPVDPSVEQQLAEEAAAGLDSPAWIEQFRAQVVRSKLELYRLLAELPDEGRPVYGIGAPSRASTLVNYVGLDDAVVACVLETSSSKKLDKYLPGTAIPVLDEAKLYAEQPPFALLLSWHIAEELMRNLTRRGYRGDFIIPLPSPHIVRNRAEAEDAQ